MLVLLDRDWGGGWSRPPDKNFQSPVWGYLQPVGGGLNPQPSDKSNAAYNTRIFFAGKNVSEMTNSVLSGT